MVVKHPFNAILKYLSAARGGPGSRYRPEMALVEPTSRCNLRCIHCFRQSEIHQNLGLENLNMSQETFRICLERLEPWLRQVTFAGYGEPLLHPEIEQLIRIATGKGIYTGMVSNGLLWNMERAEKILLAGLGEASFSLDATTEETYKKVRQGSWDKALKGLECFCEARRKLGAKTRFQFYNVLNAHNIDEASDMVRLGYRLGADEICFAPVRTEGILESDALTLEKLDRQRVVRALQKAARADENNLGNAAALAELYEKLETPHHPGTEVCYAPWNNLMILPDGSVQPCCNYFGLAKHYRFGNLVESNFMAIWNGEAYKQFRGDFTGRGVCDWCRLYPELGGSRLHKRVRKLRHLVPGLHKGRWFG